MRFAPSTVRLGPGHSSPGATVAWSPPQGIPDVTRRAGPLHELFAVGGVEVGLDAEFELDSIEIPGFVPVASHVDAYLAQLREIRVLRQ